MCYGSGCRYERYPSGECANKWNEHDALCWIERHEVDEESEEEEEEGE